MKLKDNLEISTDEFWYDLSQGYIKPEEICFDSTDAFRVRQAVNVIKDFESSCEDQIDGFLQ